MFLENNVWNKFFAVAAAQKKKRSKKTKEEMTVTFQPHSPAPLTDKLKKIKATYNGKMNDA